MDLEAGLLSSSQLVLVISSLPQSTSIEGESRRKLNNIKFEDFSRETVFSGSFIGFELLNDGDYLLC